MDTSLRILLLFKLFSSCLSAAQPLLPFITDALTKHIPTTPRTDPAAKDECEYVYETECSDGWTKVCHITYKNECEDSIENSCWKEYNPECSETPSQHCVTKKEPTETEVCEDEPAVECGNDGHDCKNVKKNVCRKVKRYESTITCHDIIIHNCQTVGREVCKPLPQQKCTLVPDGQDCKEVPTKSCQKVAKQSPALSQKCKKKTGVGAWGRK